jgi:hypothetical protein
MEVSVPLSRQPAEWIFLFSLPLSKNHLSAKNRKMGHNLGALSGWYFSVAAWLGKD